MGWQLRSRRLTRQAVCVALKVGTVTSRTCCPSSPAKTGGRQADEPPGSPPVRGPSPERGLGGGSSPPASPLSSLDWKRGALPQK